jgi:hypothetical protein
MDIDGDLDGDAAPDLVVGANNQGWGFERYGRAYVFLSPLEGGTHAAGGADITLEAPDGAVHVGSVAQFGGDLNADGCSDLLVGAEVANDMLLFLFYGCGLAPGRLPVDAAPAWFGPAETGDRFGLTNNAYPVADIDLDGDGVDDLLAGAYNAGESNEGAVYGFLGVP